MTTRFQLIYLGIRPTYAQLVFLPKLVSAPQVTGDASLGGTLSTTDGFWLNNPTSFTYSWIRDGVTIIGATAPTYVITSADLGHLIASTVVSSNSAGFSAQAFSNAVTPAAQTPPVNTAAPVISGTPSVGGTLSTTNGSWTQSPTSFTHQWKRAGAIISGATGSTYIPVSGDAGATITCATSATNTAGTSAAAASNALTIAASGVLAITFGKKTLVGLGGKPVPAGVTIGSTPTGTGGSDWVIDNRRHIVPSGATYGAVKTFTQNTYSLGLDDGSSVAINMLDNAAHATGVNDGSAQDDFTVGPQIARYLGLAQSAAGAMKLGDTIYCRDGVIPDPTPSGNLDSNGVAYTTTPADPTCTAINPQSLDMRIKPPAGGYGGAGTITAAGTGFTNGTYFDVPLMTTSGVGVGATAIIIVAANKVSSVHINCPGSSYAAGDILTVGASALGVGGTGFIYTVINLAGRITVQAETIDATVDGFGVAKRGGGTQICSIVFSSAAIGEALMPIDFRYFKFYNKAYYDPSLTKKLNNFTGYSTGGYGVSALDCRFENDQNFVPGAGANNNGFANRGGQTQRCYFVHVGRGVAPCGTTSGLTTTDIQDNTFDYILSDGMSAAGTNFFVQNNFGKNFRDTIGAHPDFFQHGGIKGALIAGSGYTPTTSATVTYTNVPMTGAGCSGVKATIVVKAGKVILPVTITTWGTGLTPSTVLTATNGNADIGGTGSGFSYTCAGFISNIGIWRYNISVRNIGLPGVGDSQGIFLSDTTDIGYIAGAVIENNILINTAQNGLSLQNFKGPIVRGNTVISQLNTGNGNLSMQINVVTSAVGSPNMVDGTWDRNISTANALTLQGGTPTISNNITLGQVAANYNACFQGYHDGDSPGYDTRALVIAAVAPILNGTAKIVADNSYAGALFPDLSWNDFAPYVPGRLPKAA